MAWLNAVKKGLRRPWTLGIIIVAVVLIILAVVTNLGRRHEGLATPDGCMRGGQLQLIRSASDVTCITPPQCTQLGGTGVSGRCMCRAGLTWNGERCTDGSGSIVPGLKVIAYDDPGYGGATREYTKDEPDLGSFDNKISSLKIPKGLRVELYQKKNYGGKKLTLEANEHNNLRHWAFDDWTDYRGKSYKEGQYYGEDVCGPGRNTHCWNDSASSIKIMKA